MAREIDFGEVLAAAKRGDPAAIETLYRRTAPQVIGYLRASGSYEPEDVAGDAYVSMMTSLHRFEGNEEQFRAWLFTIAHRRLVDVIRRADRRPETPVATETLEPTVVDVRDPESEALSRLRLSGVLDVIDGLTDDQRAVLLLRTVSDLSVPSIAEVLGKPESAVKALLRRAMATLQRRIDEDDEREETEG